MQDFASQLHRSKYYIILQSVMLLASIVAVSSLPFAILFKIVMIMGLIGYTWRNLQMQYRWQGVGHNEEGWYLVQQGKKVPIVPTGDSLVTSWVSVLRFAGDQRYLKQSCVIFRDALPAELYREFVLRMRCFG